MEIADNTTETGRRIEAQNPQSNVPAHNTQVVEEDFSTARENVHESTSAQSVEQSVDGGIVDNTSDCPLPCLSTNQQRVRNVLTKLHREARLDVDEDMLEEGFQPTVGNLQTRIIILPRPDLRQEFREQAFDSCGDMWRVEHVFTSAGKNLQNVSLESLFEDIPKKIVESGRTYRVVAISSAGCGKTTLFTKVAPFRWATGDLWSQLFDLVFAREFRYEEVRQAKNAHDLLDLDGLRLSMAERRDVLQHVIDHPDRVCLVLDGLDETSLKKCSKFVQDVIRGEQMRGIRLVLTSRPSGDVFKLTDGSRHDRKVELVGFSPEDVKQYVRKILNVEEATQLLEKIDNHPHVLSMMSTPVLAYEICKLYHWRKQVPRCVADIFELMILRLAERRSDFEYKSWADIPKSVQVQILSLSSYAFKMLQEQRLVFSDTELQCYSILRDAIALGLLVACDNTPADGSVKQWRFSHLTLQENLASKFVSCSGTMSGGKIVELVEYFGPDAGHMRTFWMLLAAKLNSLFLETLVNSLLFREKRDDSDLPRMIIAQEAKLSFPLKFHHLLCEQLCRSSMNQLAEILLSSVVHKSGSGTKLVESKITRAHSPRDDDFLQTLLLTWVEECPAAGESMLVEAVSTVDRGSGQLCLELMDQNHGSTCEPFSLSVPSNAHFNSDPALYARRELAFQCFAEYALHHDCAVEPVPSITACLRHEGGALEINGDCNPWLCRTLDVVIQHHSQAVRSVTLDALPSRTTGIPPSLHQCTKLEEVMVRQAPLQYVSAMIHSSSSTMKALKFNVSITDRGMESLAAGISACSHLETLIFSYATLSLPSVTLLANSLAALSSLVTVNLDGSLGYDVGDQAMPLLCHALSKCVQLKILNFADCHLRWCSLAVVGASLPHWPNLSELNLSNNKSTLRDPEEQCRIFVNAVNEHPHLHRLFLSSAFRSRSSFRPNLLVKYR